MGRTGTSRTLPQRRSVINSTRPAGQPTSPPTPAWSATTTPLVIRLNSSAFSATAFRPRQALPASIPAKRMASGGTCDACDCRRGASGTAWSYCTQPDGAPSHRARSVRPLDNAGPYGCCMRGCPTPRTGAYGRPNTVDHLTGHTRGIGVRSGPRRSRQASPLTICDGIRSPRRARTRPGRRRGRGCP